MKFCLSGLLFFLVLQSCKTPRSQFVFEKVLWAAAWSPDGEYIAVGGNQNGLKLYSANDMSLVKAFPISNTITKLRWHPSRPLLAVSTQLSSEPSLLLDVSTSELVPLDSICKVGARGLGWSADGAYLAVGENEGMLSIFTAEGQFLKKVRVDPKVVTGLSWHPELPIIVTVGSDITMYNVETDELRHLKDRTEEVLMLCVAWHPSGAFFATGDYGDNELDFQPLLQFWNLEGKRLKVIEGSKAEYRNLAWTSDGAYLATASDKARIWTKEGELVKSKSFGHLLWGIDWHPDGGKLVVTGENGEVGVVNFE